MFSKWHVFVFDSMKPSAHDQRIFKHSTCLRGGIQAGSSIRLIAGLIHAADRRTTNSKPSDDTSVTYSVWVAMLRAEDAWGIGVVLRGNDGVNFEESRLEKSASRRAKLAA